MGATSARRSRSERADRRGARRRPPAFGGSPPRNSMRPLELLDEEQVEAVHDASLRLLQEIGIEFIGDDARGALATGGAAVDDETGLVRMPRELVEHALADRKSTRLNSSHSQISYAVFCLKKK